MGPEEIARFEIEFLLFHMRMKLSCNINFNKFVRCIIKSYDAMQFHKLGGITDFITIGLRVLSKRMLLYCIY